MKYSIIIVKIITPSLNVMRPPRSGSTAKTIWIVGKYFYFVFNYIWLSIRLVNKTELYINDR